MMRPTAPVAPTIAIVPNTISLPSTDKKGSAEIPSGQSNSMQQDDSGGLRREAINDLRVSRGIVTE